MAKLALFILLFFATGQIAIASTIQYVYLNAGEDNASGGHAALKIDDEVYHFQHVPPGLLRIKRDDYQHFRFQYVFRENRSLHLLDVEVTAETKLLLREHFNRILLMEDEQFEALEAMENGLQLLQALLALANDGETTHPMEVKGAGLFFANAELDPSSGLKSTKRSSVEANLVGLAQRAEATYGQGFLPAKTSDFLLRIQALGPASQVSPNPPLVEDHFEPSGYAFSDRYADDLGALAAISVLAHGKPLREGSLLRPSGAEFQLNDAEVQGLLGYKNQLEN
ncbi:MAG: hypothetical protein ACOYMG_11160, partial [Candidatus Methylumidiphilus sp.]